jgi:hypothetical protein
MRHHVRSALVVVALFASACGSGSKEGSGSDPSTSPSVDASAAAASAAAAAASTAEQVVVALGDLGTGWKVHTDAAGNRTTIRPTGRLGCSMDDFSVRPWVAMYDGAILQKTGTNRYVTSTGLVFADEAAAKAYIARASSPKFLACHLKDRAEADHKISKDSSTKWRADAPKAGTPPLEVTIDLYFQAVVGGKLVDANGFERVFLYRSGRTVVFMAHEGSTQAGEKPTVASAVRAEVTNAGAKAIARAAL